MTPPLLIHIGYHKTATTWMQRQLFMPAHGYRQICGHREVFNHVVRPHGLRFDPGPMQEIIARGLGTLAPGETAVISSEILSGHPFLGGHESDVYAERLARIAPQARILISIRDQMRILPSVYMQYVLRGGTLPAARFFDGTNAIGYFGFEPGHFEYDLLVAHYQRLFGAGHVHVLTQESLKHEIAATMQRLADFAGNTAFQGLIPEALHPVGESYPEHAAPVLRRINHIQRSTLNPWPILSVGQTPKGLYKIAGYALKRPLVARLFGSGRPVSALVRQRFAGRYAASNARLAALIPHPVNLLDYEGCGQPR